MDFTYHVGNTGYLYHEGKLSVFVIDHGFDSGW